MTFSLTVLGSEPAWPSADLACSGYLLETPRARVLVDCGTGVFARLRGRTAPENLTAVLISHLHFDHWLDLAPYRYYLKYVSGAEIGPRLLLPPGGATILADSVRPIDRDEGFFEHTFRVEEYDPSSTLVIEDLSVRFMKTVHPIETYSLRIESGGKVLTYSADTGWHPPLAEHARGSDLFLCEAAFGSAESSGDMHLTAAQAGRLAADAGAAALLLTHVAAADAERSVEIASTVFSGKVAHAAADGSFEV